MKNTYQIQVRAQCPVNPSDTDLYDFTIQAESIIEVEKITRGEPLPAPIKKG